MRRRWKVAIGVLGVLVVGFGVLQFLPSGYERTNPPVVAEPEWDSPDTRALAVRACYDCHSNETIWPWYSYIAPMSWMVMGDVVRGREALNFSEWTLEQAAEFETEEAVEQVTKGQMPLPYYEILHPDARLSEPELGQLVNGMILTFEGENGEGLTTEDLDQPGGEADEDSEE